MGYLRPDLPVVVTAATAAIAKAMQDTGQAGVAGEAAYLSPRTPGKGGVLEGDRKVYHRRPFRLLRGELSCFSSLSPAKTKALEGHPWERAEAPLPLGPFRVEAFPVDHSVPGAAAFAVETPEGLVVYTGDLRRHGRWGEKTEGFLRALEGREVFLLILEGTRLGQRGKALTEGEVAENLHRLLAGHPGAPAAVDFAPRNLERLLSCLEVGKEVGRKLVVTPKDAYLLLDLRLLERALGRDPGEGVYVFSNSYWADQEQVLDLRVLLAWLERLRFRLYPEALGELPQDPSGVENPFHTSGHAPEGDLLEVVRRLRPRHLLPVHTERPERWRELLRGEGIEVQI